MSTLKVTSYRFGKALPQFHFFVLCKGNNSGRPMLVPCPNCFVVSAANADELNHYYWLTYALFNAREFEVMIKGSVIPFITIGDFKKVLQQGLTSCPVGHEQLLKMVGVLTQLDEKEKNARAMVKTILDLRRVMLHQFLKLG